MLRILINVLMLAIMGQVSVSSPKGCDELANPENGIVVVTGTKATYSCVSGYNLFGNVNRVCSEQHGWNGTEPVCYKDCPKIQYNPQTILQINGHHYQSVATYTCLVGHCRETGDFNRSCLANGTWSGSELVCGKDCTQTTNGVTSGQYNHTVSVSSPKGCDELANPENGMVVVIGIQATYSCVSGYNLFGNVNRFCSEQHGWNGTEPVCYKDCPKILNNPQTILQINGHHYQSVAMYTCLVGHCRETGDFNRTCLANGTWSGSELVCGKDCIQTTDGVTSGQDNLKESFDLKTLITVVTVIAALIVGIFIVGIVVYKYRLIVKFNKCIGIKTSTNVFCRCCQFARKDSADGLSTVTPDSL